MRCRSAVTGVPVRRDFDGVPDIDLCDLEVSGDPLRLLVLGGSQGATRLNEALPAALAAARLAAPLEVLHQTGAANLAQTAQAYGAHFAEVVPQRYARDGLAIELAPFVDDVAGELARCHLVVSRAGAITLAELCAAGRGALLVPLRLAGAHQLANARALAAAGAAVIVEEDADGFVERLAHALVELLGSPAELRAMGARARALGAPRAAALIAERVEQLAGRAAA
jgi:UDP-N-acetylglucosamine--N-acetylmuramyl-(pentapeptide) pyrophosphoryl-undecaprenol N-acetylglucosamine transferase